MAKSTRGRPPQYNRGEALAAAMQTFHEHGFAATSLDDLAAAMNMNRPSVYNAFGNKESLYRRSLEYFIEQMRAVARARLDADPELGKALQAFYGAALDVYYGQDPALGCFVFCTAPAEAIAHPEIGQIMRDALLEIDQALEQRFLRAQQDGQFPLDQDCRAAARLAQSVLHSLALRTRAGEPRRDLNRLVKYTVRTLCTAV